MDETPEAKIERLEAALRLIGQTTQTVKALLAPEFAEAPRDTTLYKAMLALVYIQIDVEQALNVDRNVWAETFSELPIMQDATIRQTILDDDDGGSAA